MDGAGRERAPFDGAAPVRPEDVPVVTETEPPLIDLPIEVDGERWP